MYLMGEGWVEGGRLYRKLFIMAPCSMNMRITIDIDTPEEMKEISAFLEKKRHPEHSSNFEERRKRLEKLFSEIKGHLPENYKFDREEAHERKSLR